MRVSKLASYAELICGYCGEFVSAVPFIKLMNGPYKTRCDNCYRGVTYSAKNNVIDCVTEDPINRDGSQWVPGLVLVSVGETNPVYMLCEAGFHSSDPKLRATLEEFHQKQFYINENSVLTNTIPVVETFQGMHCDVSESVRFLGLWGAGDTEAVRNVNRLPVEYIDVSNGEVEDEEFGHTTPAFKLYKEYRELEAKTTRLRKVILDGTYDNDSDARELGELLEKYGDKTLFWWLLANCNEYDTIGLQFENHTWLLAFNNGFTIRHVVDF